MVTKDSSSCGMELASVWETPYMLIGAYKTKSQKTDIELHSVGGTSVLL